MQFRDDDTNSQLHPGEEANYPSGKITEPPFYRRYGWQILVCILILGVILLAVFNVILLNRRPDTVKILGTQIATSIPTQPHVEPTQVPTQTPLTYPTLAVQYNGTIINTTSTPMPASLTLAAIMQAGTNISGQVIIGVGLAGSGPFTGVIDTHGKLSFSNAPSDGGGPIIFSGSLKADGSLTGTYTIPSANNQFGTWDVKPA